MLSKSHLFLPKTHPLEGEVTILPVLGFMISYLPPPTREILSKQYIPNLSTLL